MLDKRAGFTLAELVVASAVLTLVLTAVYTAFNNTAIAWRLGEGGEDFDQKARHVTALISRELHSLEPHATEYLEGADDEIAFFTIGQPMDVEAGEGPQVMYVRYYTRDDRLYRDEARLDGPIPVLSRDRRQIRKPKLSLEREERFVLADGVDEFRLAYVWMDTPSTARDSGVPPPPATPIVEEGHRLGWGKPHAIRMSFRFEDEQRKESRAFDYDIVFRGQRNAIPDEIKPRRGGRR